MLVQFDDENRNTFKEQILKLLVFGSILKSLGMTLGKTISYRKRVI